MYGIAMTILIVRKKLKIMNLSKAHKQKDLIEGDVKWLKQKPRKS